MSFRPFARRFPPELELDILERLGQSDLTRTALVCTSFRDISRALLFRHVARWAVATCADGEQQYCRLMNTRRVLVHLKHDLSLGRHVQCLDIDVRLLSPLLTPENLKSIWCSLTNLVALSLQGTADLQLALSDIHFPRLRRLRADARKASAAVIPRHLAALTHLRTRGPIELTEPQTVHLTHYDGPFEPLLAEFRFTSLEYCNLRLRAASPDVGRQVLLALSRHSNLRTLRFSASLTDADMARIFAGCPPFHGIRDLLLIYGGKVRNLHVRRRGNSLTPRRSRVRLTRATLHSRACSRPSRPRGACTRTTIRVMKIGSGAERPLGPAQSLMRARTLRSSVSTTNRSCDPPREIGSGSAARGIPTRRTLFEWSPPFRADSFHPLCIGPCNLRILPAVAAWAINVAWSAQCQSLYPPFRRRLSA